MNYILQGLIYIINYSNKVIYQIFRQLAVRQQSIMSRVLSSMELQNPYQNHYRSLNFDISSKTSKKQTETIITQLGLLHNTIGFVIKDLVYVVSSKFNENEQSQKIGHHSQISQSMQQQKPIRQTLNFQQKNDSKDNLKFENSKVDQKFVTKTAKPKQSQNDYPQQQSFDQYCFNQIRIKNTTSQNLNKKTTVESELPQKISKEIIDLDDDEDEDENNYKEKSIKENQMYKNINEKLSSYNEDSYSYNKVQQLLKSPINKQMQKVQIFRAEPMNRNQRNSLKGQVCENCRKFYQALGDQYSNICQCSSRHRSNVPLYQIKNSYSQQIHLSDDD